MPHIMFLLVWTFKKIMYYTISFIICHCRGEAALKLQYGSPYHHRKKYGGLNYSYY